MAAIKQADAEPARINVEVKARKGGNLSPYRSELLVECGEALKSVVQEVSPHSHGDRKIVLGLTDSGQVQVAVKSISAHDFDHPSLELEQMAISKFLGGMGALRATPQMGNPVQVHDDKKGIHVTVESPESLARLLNAKARASGTTLPIAQSLIIASEQEAANAKGKGR